MARKTKKEPEHPRVESLQPIEQGRALVPYEGRGRPSLYCEYTVKIILDRLMDGESLRRICATDPTLPKESTVRKWAGEDRNGFYARYVRARDMGLDSMAEEMLDIADDGSNDWMTIHRRDGSETEVVNTEAIMRSTLRIQTRKWLLSHLAARRYGSLQRIDDRPPEAIDLRPDYVLPADEPGPNAPIL